DPVACPAPVVRLEARAGAVEALARGRDLAEVMRPARAGGRPVRHVGGAAVRAHRVDVGGPLLDEDDVLAGEGEVGADRGAVSPGPDDRDPACEHLLALLLVRTVRVAPG